MPIRHENRHRYPSNWRDVRAAILERARHRCEWEGCRAPHATLILRDRRQPERWSLYDLGRGQVPTKERAVLCVLTIAHLDHTPENCDPSNLLALCQLHHNRLDAHARAAGIRQRSRVKKEAAGQLTLDE